MERGRLCNELLHLPVVQIICLETEFGKDGFNVPGQVKELGNKYGHMILQHLLLPQPLLLRSIKTTWAACSR